MNINGLNYSIFIYLQTNDILSTKVIEFWNFQKITKKNVKKQNASIGLNIGKTEPCINVDPVLIEYKIDSEDTYLYL